MADILPEFEVRDQRGHTVQYAGTVGTVATLVPAVAGNKLEIAIIRCPSQTPSTRTLLWSLDDVTYHQLSVGEFIGWEFRQTAGGADIKQIYIKGDTANVEYELVINFRETP